MSCARYRLGTEHCFLAFQHSHVNSQVTMVPFCSIQSQLKPVCHTPVFERESNREFCSGHSTFRNYLKSLSWCCLFDGLVGSWALRRFFFHLQTYLPALFGTIINLATVYEIITMCQPLTWLLSNLHLHPLK